MTTKRHALVTGATSDLGQAITRALLARGHAVTAVGRRAARLQELVDTGASAAQGDLADAGFLAALVEQPVDIFVHAAGHRFTYARFAFTDPDDDAALWATDHDAFRTLARACIPGMMARRFGRVVAVTSLVAQVGASGAAAYAAAKAAVEATVRNLALEYARFGVTANAVAPGPIATERLRARLDEEGVRRLARAVPLGRVAGPDDVAAPVVFLCSDEARFINGVTLPVSGGMHLNTLW